MQAYKVMRRTKAGDLVSITVEGDAKVTYQPDRIMHHLHMFIFLDLSLAKSFMAGFETDMELWECDIAVASSAPRYLLHTALIDDHWLTFWAGKWERTVDDIPSISGSYTTGALKLIRRIQ